MITRKPSLPSISQNRNHEPRGPKRVERLEERPDRDFYRRNLPGYALRDGLPRKPRARRGSACPRAPQGVPLGTPVLPVAARLSFALTPSGNRSHDNGYEKSRPLGSATPWPLGSMAPRSLGSVASEPPRLPTRRAREAARSGLTGKDSRSPG
jgi:hypothetical protein